ncbi:MAG: hypothetical protein V3U03_17555 [Myxococcota bacterium]
MPAKTRDELKSKFETNDVPTQQDFQDLIDSFVLVSEGFVTHDDQVVVHEGDVVTLT